jgi:hypothetical protein
MASDLAASNRYGRLSITISEKHTFELERGISNLLQLLNDRIPNSSMTGSELLLD